MAKKVTENEKKEFLKLVNRGWLAQQIADKFKKKIYIILHWARKNHIEFQRAVRYCVICGSLIENDTTKCHTKKYCSPKCVVKSAHLAHRIYYKKHHVNRGYEGQLGKNRIRRYPKYKCEEGHITQLTFDPRKWRSTQSLREYQCPECMQQKTAD